MKKLGLTVERLCLLVKGTTSLDQSFYLEHLTSLEAAGEKDLAVVLPRGDQSVFDDVDPAVIAQSHAALILAQRPLSNDKHFLVVEDPLHAYTQIIQYLDQSAAHADDAMSSSAHIADDVVMGTGVSIGANAVIESGVRLGSYVHIGANAVIQPGVYIADSAVIDAGVVIGAQSVIGTRTIIHRGAMIGSDGFGYQTTKTGLRKIPHIGTVLIGAHVEIGAGCCIDRATFEATRIGDGTKLDNMVHVAHNAFIGSSTAILAHTSIGGGARIGNGCQIGCQVAIKDHVSIGDGAKVVSKAGVIKDVAAGMTVAGTPATDFYSWKRTRAALALLAAPKKGSDKGVVKEWSDAIWHKVADWLDKGKQD